MKGSREESKTLYERARETAIKAGFGDESGSLAPEIEAPNGRGRSIRYEMIVSTTQWLKS